MKKIAALLLTVCFVVACKHTQQENPYEVKVKLTKAMIDNLYKEGKFDSNTVKYEVLDTIIYEEKYAYLCHFKVHVKAKNYDTTGIMSAEITKDMSKVKRQY